jgi:hypothetical protein
MALLAALMLALGSRNCVGLTDNILCMPLPRGWSHSVAFGHTPTGAAAWMHAGNFRFRKGFGLLLLVLAASLLVGTSIAGQQLETRDFRGSPPTGC